MSDMNKQIYKTKINEEKQRILNLQNKLSESKEKLARVRRVALTSTVCVFAIHVLGIIGQSPLLIVGGLSYLLITCVMCGHKQFKLMDIEEKISKEISKKEDLIEEYKKKINDNIEIIDSIPLKGNKLDYKEKVNSQEKNAKNKIKNK